MDTVGSSLSFSEAAARRPALAVARPAVREAQRAVREGLVTARRIARCMAAATGRASIGRAYPAAALQRALALLS